MRFGTLGCGSRAVLWGGRHGVLACVLLQALSAQAQTAPAAASSTLSAAALVRPGAWNVTPQAVAGLSLAYQLCFKTGSLDDIKMLMPNIAGGDGGCAAPSISVTPGLVTWRYACAAQAQDADARYTLTPERIEGVFHLTLGTPPVSSSQSISAQHAGACPP